jgi:aspartate/methionine/tyrosine aminotransferase
LGRQQAAKERASKRKALETIRYDHFQTIAAFDRIGEETPSRARRANALAVRVETSLSRHRPAGFRTPEHIVDAAIKGAARRPAWLYAAVGIPALREAIARRTLAPPASRSRRSACWSCWRQGPMFAAILLFGEPGAEILYPDPGFPIYRSMIEFTGADRSRPDPRGETASPSRPRRRWRSSSRRPRLLILNSPANPTGGVTPRSRNRQAGPGLARWPATCDLSTRSMTA